MLVTGIERTKKGRYSIYCDGEFYCALHADVFALSPIKAGLVMEVEEMEDLRAQSGYKITKDKALRLLAARAYTAFGLKRKLTACTDEDNASCVVAEMAELGLIDDLDYARRYTSDCINLKGYSVYRTEQALKEKGINRDIIDQVMEERDDDPEPAIAKVILRKYIRYLEDDKGLNKTVNAMLRLGYRYDEIQTVLENLAEDIAYYDEQRT